MTAAWEEKAAKAKKGHRPSLKNCKYLAREACRRRPSPLTVHGCSPTTQLPQQQTFCRRTRRGAGRPVPQVHAVRGGDNELAAPVLSVSGG